MPAHIQAQDVAYFLLVTVLLKMVIGGVVTDYLRRGLKKWLIRSERDLVVWLHYRNHAAGNDHKPRHPAHCEDGDCQNLR